LIFADAILSLCQFVKKFKSSKTILFIVRREQASMVGPNRASLFLITVEYYSAVSDSDLQSMLNQKRLALVAGLFC
jgi:hypothetical protein